MILMPQKIRILIADDHAMFREALRSVLEREQDFRVVGEAANGTEAIEQVGKLKPDVLLLDLAMPHLPGMEALRRLSKDLPNVRTFILDDATEKRQIIEALTLGARGIVPKDTSTQLLFKSIRAVASGEIWVGHRSICDLIDFLQGSAAPEREPATSNGHHLTPRQINIVTSIVDGYTNKEIADRFSISEQTVKHHLTSIFEKLGVSNRLELALLAMHQSFQ